MVPKWSQNGEQHPGNSWTFLAILQRRLQGGQMEAKELENGAKMEPKVSLRRRQGGQMEAKELQNGAKMESQASKGGIMEMQGVQDG